MMKTTTLFPELQVHLKEGIGLRSICMFLKWYKEAVPHCDEKIDKTHITLNDILESVKIFQCSFPVLHEDFRS